MSQPPWYIICCVRADGLYGGGVAGRTDKALAWGLLQIFRDIRKGTEGHRRG